MKASIPRTTIRIHSTKTKLMSLTASSKKEKETITICMRRSWILRLVKENTVIFYRNLKRELRDAKNRITTWKRPMSYFKTSCKRRTSTSTSWTGKSLIWKVRMRGMPSRGNSWRIRLRSCWRRSRGLRNQKLHLSKRFSSRWKKSLHSM